MLAPSAPPPVASAISSWPNTVNASSMSPAVPNWNGPSPSRTPHFDPRGSGLVVPLPSVPHQDEQVDERTSDGGDPRFHMRRNSGLTANPGPDSGTSRPSSSSLSPCRSGYQPHTAQATMPRRKSLSSL